MATATELESAREYAENVGREHPDRAWILDHRDAWFPNPFYVGPPQRHPEDDGDLYASQPHEGDEVTEADFDAEIGAEEA